MLSKRKPLIPLILCFLFLLTPGGVGHELEYKDVQWPVGRGLDCTWISGKFCNEGEPL